MIKINWAAAIVDIFIMGMSVTVSIWRDNAFFLFLMLGVFLTGSYEIKDVKDEL